MNRAAVSLVAALAACLAAAAPVRGQVSADVGVSVAAGAPSVNVREQLTYTLTVENKGPELATAVHVTSELTGVVAQIVSATPSQGSCDIGSKKDKVDCNLGRISARAAVQVALVVLPTSGGELVNTAAVRTSRADPDMSNQRVELRTRIAETSAPVVTLGGKDFARAFQKEREFELEWTGTDADSAVTSFDVRYRQATHRRGFGAFVAWKSKTTLKRAAFVGRPGSTYCFSARATDAVGNVSPWTPERCTAIPLSTTSLARSGPWRTLRKPAYYAGRVLQSRWPGSALVLPRVAARRVALVVTTCAKCGAVDVLWNGRRIKRVSLFARDGGKTRLISVARFPRVRAGTLVLKVVSDRKRRVKIEGVGVSRA